MGPPSKSHHYMETIYRIRDSSYFLLGSDMLLPSRPSGFPRGAGEKIMRLLFGWKKGSF